MMARRESLWVLAQIVMLALPQLLAIIAPIATMIAVIVALSRLRLEREIDVMRAAGASDWSLAAPAMRIACIVTVLSLFANLWLQPVSFQEMRRTLHRVRADLLATALRPGEFTHPSHGATFYVQSIDPGGRVHNLFIDQRNAHGSEITIMARDGIIEKRAGALTLALRNGVNQESSPDGALSFLAFDEYALDLQPFVAAAGPVLYKPSDGYVADLVAATRETDRPLVLLAEIHNRIATALYPLTFAMLGVAAVLTGELQRNALALRIALACGTAIALRLSGFAATNMAVLRTTLNVLQYLPPVLGFGAATIYYLRLAGRRAQI
jgi:lipopolysaccharide export system permease protein